MKLEEKIKMQRLQNWIFTLIIVLISGQLFGQNKEIIGCYQSWKRQHSPELLNPQNIPYDKLTMINYSFFYPLESGEIVGMDPAADLYLLKGDTDLSYFFLKFASFLAK